MVVKRALIMAVFLSISFLFLPYLLRAQPMAVAEPPKGKPETKLVIKGSGFKPEEIIEIILKLSEEEKIGLGTTKVDFIKTDLQGNFEAETAFPVFAKPGVYEVLILGDKGSECKLTIEVLPK